MTGPPSVEIQLKRTRFQFIFCIALIGLAIVETAGVVASCPRCAISGWVSLALAVFAGVAVSNWYFHPQGILAWTGKAWRLRQAENEIDIPSVHWAIDFQKCLLIRLLDSHGKSRWIWLESANFDMRWLAFRRALVFSSKVAAFRLALQASEF